MIMMNPMQPQACEILSIEKQTALEYTFRVKSDAKPAPGQFMQLSVPKVGECPISVSGIGDGWLEFTIRSVGQVTDCIFTKKPGDVLFIRGPYGKGWPLDAFKGKDIVIVAGGTGVSPVRELINTCADVEGFAKTSTLIACFKNEESILFKDDLAKWEKKLDRTIYALDKDEYPGWKIGMATEFIKDIDFASLGEDYVFVVVGPPAMMKFVCKEALACGAKVENMWLSFERKMSCGIGKCGHCRIDEVYVCTDGPVFPYTVAKDLVD